MPSIPNIQLECLTDVVGLSPDACECFDDGRPTGYDVSRSGLYISELVPMNITQGAVDCEKGGIWDIMQTAKANGINEFLREYIKGMQTIRDRSRQGYKGLVGSKKFNFSKSDKQFVGIVYKPNCQKGGFVSINGFQLALDGVTSPTNIDLQIWTNREGELELLTTETVTVSQNKKFEAFPLTSPVKIDLTNVDHDTENTEYYFVFEMPVGLKWLNNTIAPHCCGGLQKKLAKNPFLYYGWWQGVQTDDLSNIDSNRTVSDVSHGLLLDIVADCDPFSWMCNLAFSVNESITLASGEQFQLGAGIAKIIQIQCAIKLLHALVKTTNINPVIMMSREVMFGTIRTLQREYESNMAWLITEVPATVNDCFRCKQDRSIGMHQILT